LTLDGTATENDPSVVDPGNTLTPDSSGVLSQTDDRTGGSPAGADDGEVRIFESATDGTGPVGPRSWVAGSIPFQVLTPNDDGIIDIRADVFSFLEGFFDNAGNEVFPTFNGAQVTVPEPRLTSIVACGLAAFSAVWIRRRRRSVD